MSVSEQRPSGLISAGAGLEELASGFGFTEGPAWSDAGSFLVFSDIPGNAMWRWDEAGGVQPFRSPSNMGNGSTFDDEGRLVTCEHATSRVVREEAGQLSVIAESYQGRQLNSPNDVVVASDGSILFSDPTYGRGEYFGVPRVQELDFQGVFRVPPGGGIELLAADFGQPNGLCFSLDGETLYVNDTERMHIRSFRIRDDGSLDGGSVWAELTGDGPGGPDGMKLDAEGHVYCTGPGGIHVFDNDGSHMGWLATPEVVGNLAWGGADHNELFICASTSLYKIHTEVTGA